ncbi:hydantoinase/oxoprolinase N-terminal domain-containing protein [Chloroflexota bacterium]
MSIFLGIDTGGTYTDAVLLDDEHGIINSAKALTTRYDLSTGIQNAVRSALPNPKPDIHLVSLSSTLATNSIVEGKGSPICLILIGYDPQIIADVGFERLSSKHIVFVGGGHTVKGDEQAPLDTEAARKAILKYAPRVAAFAISGYFGVLNPTHELRVKQLVRRLTGLPVTCGHELTTNLDAPIRALTVALNARLIPLLHHLIHAVHKLLATQGITAPLMVVKGDGSLMDATMALERPVETIMSGPAASVIGALYLCQVKDALVIDMGGTTTDIAAVHDGYPSLNHQGARVGGWQTMVEAADIHTTGLGGDSEIHLNEAGDIIAGPRRVVPLSILAREYPIVSDALRRQLKGEPDRNAGRFIMRERALGIEQDSITSIQQEIWELLGDGPMPVAQLMDSVKAPIHFGYSLDGLMERGLITVSAFTPTDAVHVLGQYNIGNAEAARAGAELWSRRLGTSKREFCERVVKKVLVQAGHAVIESTLTEEEVSSLTHQDSVGRLFINQALGADDSRNFQVTISLRRPLIGIGAPAATYLAPLAERLNAEIHIPEHAGVANAIGAVAGGVVQSVRILIQQPWGKDHAYRAYLPFGIRDFVELDDAIAYARDTAYRLARDHAHQAGASRVKLQTEQNDWMVPVAGDKLYLGTEIITTAVGRPRLKGRSP